MAHALKLNKNIVPVVLSGVTEFPKNLPDDISEVVKKQAANHHREHFDSFYKKLRSMLTSWNKYTKITIYVLSLIMDLQHY